MRGGLGLVGLLVVLVIVGLLVKKQLASTKVALPPAVQQSAEGASQAGNVRQQSEQLQQQVQRQVQDLMQQQRPMPEDKP